MRAVTATFFTLVIVGIFMFLYIQAFVHEVRMPVFQDLDHKKYYILKRDALSNDIQRIYYLER